MLPSVGGHVRGPVSLQQAQRFAHLFGPVHVNADDIDLDRNPSADRKYRLNGDGNEYLVCACHAPPHLVYRASESKTSSL
jgi:hypothetical protein